MASPGRCGGNFGEVKPPSGTPRSRWLAIALASTLVGLAVVAYVLAALLDFTLSGSQTTDPNRAIFFVAGLVGAACCINALRRLRDVAHARATWFAAGGAFGLAIFALFLLLFLAFASRLGG